MDDSVGEITDQQDQSERKENRAGKTAHHKHHRGTKRDRVAGRIGSVFFDDQTRQGDRSHRVHQDQVVNAIGKLAGVE
ncbi:hypothetical protein [Stieleria mannarensis]|uniref:hypothetical protein n=1 Tax=Stieleria mannarensis TaxID=2755585 RepID=UPI0015FF59D5